MLREFGTVQRFCMFCNGCERWEAPGKPWETPGGSGMLWGALGCSGGAPEMFGRLWGALGGLGKPRGALGGSGRLWESLGYLLK